MCVPVSLELFFFSLYCNDKLFLLLDYLLANIQKVFLITNFLCSICQFIVLFPMSRL